MIDMPHEYPELRDALITHSERIFESLEGVSPTDLRHLASGLSLAQEPVASLASPFFSHAGGSGQLAMLQMRGVLRQIAFHHENFDNLIERLERMEQPPWPELREALVAIRPLRPEPTPAQHWTSWPD